MLSSVQLCGESEANSGMCSEASKIGTTRVATGAGSHPFEVEGKVYLTGPHNGAPFGLSIVTNAVAGPFNLGLVIVRARIDVNPENSTLTVTTDETGSYALPQIIDGVPLRLKRITVNIDRPNFMFNPTNCGAPGQPGAQQVTARISGSENAVADVQSQFAVGGCEASRSNPGSRCQRVGTPAKPMAPASTRSVLPLGSVGTEANIASVKVELPEQLPSRLTTLQKACTGRSSKRTPRVVRRRRSWASSGRRRHCCRWGWQDRCTSSPTVGKRSRIADRRIAGRWFQGRPDGSKFISKTGITSSTFKTVSDVPVNGFELYLPEGP